MKNIHNIFITIITIGLSIFPHEKLMASDINKNEFSIDFFEDNMPLLNEKKDCKNYLLIIRTTDKTLEYAVIDAKDEFKFSLIKDEIKDNVITYSSSKCISPLKSIKHIITIVTRDKNRNNSHNLTIQKTY